VDENTNQHETSIFGRPNAVDELSRNDERAKTRKIDLTVGREPEMRRVFGRFAFRAFVLSHFRDKFLAKRHHAAKMTLNRRSSIFNS
jgi:hypothetical protein